MISYVMAGMCLSRGGSKISRAISAGAWVVVEWVGGLVESSRDELQGVGKLVLVGEGGLSGNE